MGLNSTEKKALLLDSLPQCVLLVAQDGTILGFNASVEHAFGPQAASLPGASVTAAIDMLRDSRERRVDLSDIVERCLATGESQLTEAWIGPDADESFAAHCLDGKVTITVMPVGREGAQSSAAVVIDGELSMQRSGLRDAVLSMVSHELRTPLLHIKGFVSSLLESDIEWAEDTKLDFLRTIDREADRLTAMVDDLMEINRMGSIDLPLQVEPSQPYMLAYAALDSASPFTHKHRMVVNIPEDLPEIRVDPLRVMGVLVNLIQNSAKFSEEGTSITLDAEADSEKVTFSVSDQGSGIPIDARSSIFTLFYRGSGTEQTSGSGLGLAVCKAVVEAHGGEIWADCDPPEGAVFRFTIPLELPSKTPSKTKDAGDDPDDV